VLIADMNAQAQAAAAVMTHTLQELVDMHAINVTALRNAERTNRGVEAHRELVAAGRKLVREAARMSLRRGEMRRVQIGEVSAVVFTVGTGQTTLQVRRNGELLGAFTRTDTHEDESLRHFAGLIATLTR
jgi:hypothetical protein